MTQRIIEIDSQILNSIQNCDLKHEMSHVENLSPEKKAAPLEKGDLLHKMLEIYDGRMANIHDINSDTWRLLEPWHVETVNEDATVWTCKNCGEAFDCPDNRVTKCPRAFQGREEFLATEKPTKRDIIDFCLKAGQFFSAKMDLDTETSDNVMFQFNAYCEFYSNDPWETLAVEEVGSKVLFENAIIKIIYTGKIDRFVRQGNVKAPLDHKSSERRGSVSSMSNQFIGYCFLLDCNYIIIDKIGFQKTLKPAERFQRFILQIDQNRVDEWVKNTVKTILVHLLSTIEDDVEAEMYFQMLRLQFRSPLMNLTSCDKYSGCIYAVVCESAPEGRPWIKERDFVVREPWDVGAILEAPKA